MEEKRLFFGLLLVCGLISLFPYQSEALFEGCTTNDNCTDSGAYCNEGSSCVCNETTHYIINQAPNQTCEAKHALDEVCPTSPSETCLDVNAECQTVGQETTSRCRCKSGYSNSSGQCVTACVDLTDLINGAVVITNNTEGGVASYTCNEGFVINGSSSITEFTRQCSNGAWSDEEPTCSPIDCGDTVNTVTNGIATIGSNTTVNNSTATVDCDIGYEIETNIVTCQANGNWSSATCTIKDCGDTVNTVTNGIATVGNNTTVNSTATVDCDIGYEIETNIVTCQSNGNWSTATCTIKDCGSTINTVSNGIALNVENETTFNSTATVDCNGGYEIETNIITCQSNGNWSSATCTIKDCGSTVDTITNGNATVDSGTIVNSTATVNCNTGYEIDIQTITCQSNGSWSSAICTIKDCGSTVDTITNGNVTVDSETTVNSTATVNCNTGYEIDIQTITCQSNGSWSSAICTIKDCGSTVDTITNGNATVDSETTVNSTASVNCNTGYEIDIQTITCQSNGSWSSAICTIKDCGSTVDTITNGNATVDSETTVNSTASVNCNTGYEIDVPTITCQSNGNWSSAICIIKDCGENVTTVSNGTASVNTPGSTTYESTASVTCNQGFETSTTTITCTANGTWSAAVCTQQKCPTLSDGTYFTVGITSNTEGGTATYTCINGFTVADSSLTTSTRTCTNGAWDGQEPNCTRVDCGGLLNPASGTVNVSSDTLFQATATYTCDDGYTITSGNSSRTCTASGTWSGSEPTCSRRDCGGLLNPPSGTVNVSPDTLFQATATYTCDDGYTITSGDISRTCTASGTWSGSEPTCSRRDCGVLSNIANGEVNVSSTLYEDTATYICNEGYIVSSGNSSRTCTASGTWSGSEPACSRRDCGGLSNINNGEVTVSSTLYEATATYACNDGYNIASGDSTRTCTANGAWSGSEPTCSKKDCGPLTAPSDGSVDTSSGTLFEATATYSCNTGFDRVGSQTRTCTASGSWSGNPPTCTRRDCGTLGSLINGEISYYTDTKYQSVATYSCNTGYIITGTISLTSYSRTCTANGWDGSVQTCSKRDCGNLDDPADGQVNVSDSKYQGTAQYTCNIGYDITGTSSSTLIVDCLASGLWSQTGVTCTIKNCGSLLNPSNGLVSYIQTTYQSIATYTCNSGYIVSGTVSETTKTVTCTAAGSWSDTATCTIKADPLGVTCPNPDSTNLSPGQLCSGNNAFCLQRTSNSQDFTCQCNTGYYDDNGDQAAGQCKSISELMVQSIGFTSVTTTSMRVSWTAPPNKASFISGYLVQWRRKDNQVGGSTSQELTNTNFDITNNVVSGTAYVVQVTSVNTVNYSDRVESTFSQKEQALKPQKPGSINTVSSNLDAQDQQIYLVWAASSGTALQYDVSLYESGAQQALVTITTFTSTTSLYYQQMKNGYRYDVSITAVSQQYNGTNVVKSDLHREQIKTVVQVPTAPRSVQCHMTTDSSVTIKWQASLLPNGDLVGYKIDTYRLGSNVILKTENKTQNIGNMEQIYEIVSLGPGSNYYFNVFTINEKYISSATRLTETSCQTRASMADAPNDLQVSEIMSRNFSVSWIRPTNTSGEHRGYVVQVRLLDGTCVKQLLIKCTGCTGSFDEFTLENMCEQSRSTTEQLSTQTISSTTPISRMFTELDPDVNYNVIVTAVNTEGRGRIANQTLQTDEEVPQKPKDVTISNLTSTSCAVTWDIDGPRPGDTTYTVIVDAVTPVTHNNQQLTGFDKRTKDLMALQEYWNYNVTIRAETSKGSVDSDPKTFRTLPAAPGVVDGFNVTVHPNNDYRKLTVEWMIPVLLERNSVIDRFELHHNTSQDMNMGMISLPKNDDEFFVYTQTFNVTPEVYYQFKVYAINTENQTGSVTEKVVMAPSGVPKLTDQRSVINTSLTTSSQTTLKIIFDDTDYFNLDNAGPIVLSGVIICAEIECPGNEIGTNLTKVEFETYANWHKAQPKFTQYRCTRSTWRQQTANGRKRRQTGTEKEFTIGSESCNETTKNDYCNGPLNAGTSYIVHVVICTNGGCLISNQYGPFVTQTVPEDKKDSKVIIVVAVIVSLVVIIAAVIVVMVILRRRTGKKMTGMEPSKIEVMEDPATARIEKHRPIKLSEFEEKLARLHKDSNLLFSAEYEDLRTIAPSHPQEAANREENRLKNRYINILPFDHSRVKLFCNGEEDCIDFINANYLPGYRSPREYIGCQGPIPGTIDDFWRMVWEQKVSIVVMLTLCKEGQKVKCEQYWPEEQGEPKQYGDVVVEVTSTSTIQTYIMRIFKITNAGQTRTIKHFHFLSWLDFQANVKHDIILDFITHVRSHVQPPDTVGPMIVHCSAGVGRTGTYICLDHLMQFIEDHDFDVSIDIFDMVLRLRDNRPLMVQTEQQYVFIHDCVKELMDRKRKQMDNIYENQGFAADENIYQNTEPQLYENLQMKTSF